MKRIFALLICTAMLFGFAACSSKNGGNSSHTDTQGTSSPTSDVSSEPSHPAESSPDASDASSSQSPQASESPDKETDTTDSGDTAQLSISTENGTKTVNAAHYTGSFPDTGTLSFGIYYDDTVLNANCSNGAYRFTQKAESDSKSIVYFEINFIAGKASNDIMPSFIDSYIDFTDVDFSSAFSLGKSKLSANTITAFNSEQYVDAYLIDVDGGSLAIVLSSDSHDSEDLAWFNAMLDTLSVNE